MSIPLHSATKAYGVFANTPRGEWQPTQPTPAEIEWRDEIPYSIQFSDCYFSKDGGLEETRHVFLQASGFLKHCDSGQSAVVGELGFGSGLNFLATMSAWHQTRAQSKRVSHAVEEPNTPAATLHFISFERYPLLSEDRRRVYALFPELAPYSALLDERLPVPIAGIHLLEFPEFSTRLYLALGDVAEFLPLVSASVDFWFLDGFAPDRNEAMWNAEICQHLARLSHPLTQLSTFSAARAVRDALSAVGFSPTKEPGFGRKREMVRARYNTEASITVHSLTAVRTVAVVGGGLAGAAAAWACAKRGWNVQLFESVDSLAQGASGNPAGVLMPYLSVKPDFQSRFFSAGFLFTLASILAYEDSSQFFSQCGVLRLATSGRLERLQEAIEALLLPEEFAIAKNIDAASELAGVMLTAPGVWHALGGMVQPRKLAEQLCANSLVSVRTNCGVAKIVSEDECVTLFGTDGSELCAVDALIIANASDASTFIQASWLPLEPVKGQLVSLPQQEMLAALKTVVCFDGYIIPAIDGQYVLGATYEHNASSLATDESKQRELLDRLERRAPELKAAELHWSAGRAAYRSMTPDRMPIVGALPNVDEFMQHYLDVNRGQLGDIYPDAGKHSGLWVSLGHGSRGISSCLLSAEIIAARIANEPLPIETDLLRAVDPVRFLVRAAKRGLPVA